jgi:hypothetical protein
MITSEQLHDAADIVALRTSYPEDAQIEEFISESVFDNYPKMDEASLAFGICIGIVVMSLPVSDNTPNTTKE